MSRTITPEERQAAIDAAREATKYTSNTYLFHEQIIDALTGDDGVLVGRPEVERAWQLTEVAQVRLDQATIESAELRAEIAQLRAAMVEARNWSSVDPAPGYRASSYARLLQVDRIIIAALAEGDGQTNESDRVWRNPDTEGDGSGTAGEVE